MPHLKAICVPNGDGKQNQAIMYSGRGWWRDVLCATCTAFWAIELQEGLIIITGAGKTAENV